MEPDVRYCTASDGVRIAYTVSGEGPPHVLMGDPVSSHVRLTWSHPVARRLYEEWARHNTVIAFDPHGSGLSDRLVTTSLESFVRDLETVVRHLNLQDFGLSAIQGSAPAAIAYAARH